MGQTAPRTILPARFVTLSPVADVDSLFVQWSGDPDCSDGVVTMDSNMSCRAEFAIVINVDDFESGDFQRLGLSVSATGTLIAYGEK